MSTFDSDKYKEGQRQGWNNVAGGWHKWWKTTENAGENISKRMIELADIKQGFRVLDVATGLGEPAITAAQHVGNRGTVLVCRFINPDVVICKTKSNLLRVTKCDRISRGRFKNY